MPHLDAAYNLARWLMEDDADAQDAVQEASLRAFRFFGGYRGGNSRAWLLTIVRNTCYTLRQQQHRQQAAPFDETIHSDPAGSIDPETHLLKTLDAQSLRLALEKLPLEYRESLVLRELEGMSYKEIADVAGIPIGTVMSRLARARKLLRAELLEQMKKEN